MGWTPVPQQVLVVDVLPLCNNVGLLLHGSLSTPMAALPTTKCIPFPAPAKLKESSSLMPETCRSVSA